MDGPKNVMQLRLRPAQDEKPIFYHDFLSSLLLMSQLVVSVPGLFLSHHFRPVFFVMDGPKNVMQLHLRSAQDEKPIFCHDFLS